MMEDLENKTAVDPFSEEAIIASLPLEAQGELKSYGAMEDKSLEELHTILLHMREKYGVPPNHPFTALMKRHGLAARHGCNTKDNMWVSMLWYSEADYEPNIKCGNTSWRHLKIIYHPRSGKTAEGYLYINLDKEQIWSPTSESKLKTRWITMTDQETQKLLHLYRSSLFARIKELQSLGQLQDVVDLTAMSSSDAVRMGNRKRGMKSRKARQGSVSITPDTSKTTVIKDTLNDSLLIPMFELAKVKALELGMTETVKLWEEALHV